MNHIIISNITEKDAKSSKIRIKKDLKFLFPPEKIGRPETYTFTGDYNGKEFPITYTIGSKDGRSRSGNFKLGSYVFHEIMKITPATKLKIMKLNEDKYKIERL